jgi:hypothetical protein
MAEDDPKEEEEETQTESEGDPGWWRDPEKTETAGQEKDHMESRAKGRKEN